MEIRRISERVLLARSPSFGGFFEMDALVLGAGIYIGGGVVLLIIIILVLFFLFR